MMLATVLVIAALFCVVTLRVGPRRTAKLWLVCTAILAVLFLAMVLTSSSETNGFMTSLDAYVLSLIVLMTGTSLAGLLMGWTIRRLMGKEIAQ
ncbi:MAG: hypothetical protein P8Q26_08445 [Ascidiaceihabitans sp.]|nr:hypothetical protein [Ascidiaceihabitans sp.]